ncbi:hypothetical protein [Denitromonas sp.]|uniref:hypothetical protein n=1 Tax=Denitromonas sp. TaxID=2734609 RepID=UPI003A89939B
MTDHTQTPIADFRRDMLAPRDAVSANFRAYELTRSELAERRSIDNSFETDAQLQAAVHLAREVLQPVRDAFGAFTPNSVFRSQALERVLKDRPASWISTSQHTLGGACDIEIPGVATLELARWVVKHLGDFDQVICECYDPRKGPNSGWVHISLKPPGVGANRRVELSYIRDPGSGRMIYVPGLRASVA